MKEIYSPYFDNFNPADFSNGDSITVITKTTGRITGILLEFEHSIKMIPKKERKLSLWQILFSPKDDFNLSLLAYNFWTITILEPKGEKINMITQDKTVVLYDPINIFLNRTVLFDKTCKSFTQQERCIINSTLYEQR